MLHSIACTSYRNAFISAPKTNGIDADEIVFLFTFSHFSFCLFPIKYTIYQQCIHQPFIIELLNAHTHVSFYAAYVLIDFLFIIIQT